MSEELFPLPRLVGEIQAHIPDSRLGLPDELFYLVSRLPPLVNVDLLIQNEKRQTLLVWRDDAFYRADFLSKAQCPAP